MGPDRKNNKKQERIRFYVDKVGSGSLLGITSVGISILSLHSKFLLDDPLYSGSKTSAFNPTQHRFRSFSRNSTPLFLSFLLGSFHFLVPGKFDEKSQAKCHTMKCKAEACFLSEMRAKFIAERGEDFFFGHHFLNILPFIHKLQTWTLHIRISAQLLFHITFTDTYSTE